MKKRPGAWLLPVILGGSRSARPAATGPEPPGHEGALMVARAALAGRDVPRGSLRPELRRSRGDVVGADGRARRIQGFGYFTQPARLVFPLELRARFAPRGGPRGSVFANEAHRLEHLRLERGDGPDGSGDRLHPVARAA